LKYEEISWAIHKISKRINIYFSTCLSLLHCKLWGVSIARGAQFSGLIKIRTVPGSKISIGENFRAENISFNNPIGLTSPIQIQTYSKTANLIIGNDVGISGTIITCTTNIKIGNGVLLGANVRIFDSDFHPLVSNQRRYDRNGIFNKPISIGNNCWIGANVLILPGTRLGDNVVVGANAVVKGTFKDNCVIAGVPARIIKLLPPSPQ